MIYSTPIPAFLLGLVVGLLVLAGATRGDPKASGILGFAIVFAVIATFVRFILRVQRNNSEIDHKTEINAELDRERQAREREISRVEHLERHELERARIHIRERQA